ncbi:MAG TPA: ABC-F family ATP-binding cassette domain-containing protein [Syntrophomonas sp.]|nr:ABC-F family ATP-binding cassette domain-containing protein [Syntrophomonas sp.]HRW12937.1 ABC-F family ATP-binding cassette domain-containing protein [Syntrophomonas sp.]
MIILQAQKINKSFADQHVLRDISLTLQVRERVGMVGVNGAGKTTLLQCLAGLLLPDSGEISYSADMSMGYLQQLADYEDGITLWDAIMESYAEVLQLRSRLTALEEQIARGGPDLNKDLQRYARLSDEYERADGYACENTARRILSGLGFPPHEYEQQADRLSGGQKTRFNLACLLAKSPDLLFLDEPTNHLDIASVEWLEEFVKNYPGTVLVVSHDRRFLDKIATRILDLRGGKISSYEGNYSQYLVKRAADDLAWQRAYEKQQEHIRETEAYILRFKAGIKSKQARGRQSQLQRLERIDRPQQEKNLSLRKFNINQASGRDVLRLKSVAKSFDTNQLFEKLDLNIFKGEKIALVGPNGCGKTTLLKIISGRLPADAGEVRLGSRVEIGYYGQEYEELDSNHTLLEEILENFDMEIEPARTALGSMLFSEDEVFKQVKNLSGGEKGRLGLLKLILSGANFLILDEPTNHLDLDSCAIVEKMLQDYEGTVLLVSHDRYFIDQVAERIITFNNGALESYPGNYSYYQEKLLAQNKADTEARRQAARERNQPAIEAREHRKEQQRIRRQRQRALEEIELRIAELEEQKSRLEIELSDPETYRDEENARKVNEAYKGLEEALLTAYWKWEEVSAMLEEEMKGDNDELFAR